jgi:hypothetical protein
MTLMSKQLFYTNLNPITPIHFREFNTVLDPPNNTSTHNFICYISVTKSVHKLSIIVRLNREGWGDSKQFYICYKDKEFKVSFKKLMVESSCFHISKHHPQSNLFYSPTLTQSDFDALPETDFLYRAHIINALQVYTQVEQVIPPSYINTTSIPDHEYELLWGIIRTKIATQINNIIPTLSAAQLKSPFIELTKSSGLATLLHNYNLYNENPSTAQMQIIAKYNLRSIDAILRSVCLMPFNVNFKKFATIELEHKKVKIKEKVFNIASLCLANLADTFYLFKAAESPRNRIIKKTNFLISIGASTQEALEYLICSGKVSGYGINYFIALGAKLPDDFFALLQSNANNHSLIELLIELDKLKQKYS